MSHSWAIYEVVTLTTFVINLLVSLVIAAGTDYGIFFFGRYHEARQAGEDRMTAFYTTYRSVAKVVLASGLTIAGAVFCLSFARLPYFQPLGVPGAVGIIVAVAVALTLIPAVIATGSRFGLFEPEAEGHHSSMAAARHGSRPVAGADPGRDVRARGRRVAGVAGL